jgi:hypothetical protein
LTYVGSTLWGAPFIQKSIHRTKKLPEIKSLQELGLLNRQLAIVSNGLCFNKIVSLYFGAPKTTTIDIGMKRKRDFLDLLKNLPKITKI